MASRTHVQEFAEKDWTARPSVCVRHDVAWLLLACLWGEKMGTKLTSGYCVHFVPPLICSAGVVAHLAADQNPCNCCACLFRLLKHGTTLSMLIAFGAN